MPLPDAVDGKSLVPLINGGAYEKDNAYCESRNEVSIRTKEYRMVFYKDQNLHELYDHKTDAGELNNVYNDIAYRDVRLELMEKLLNITMEHLVISDHNITHKLSVKNRNTPVKLLHKHGKHWSELKELYGDNQ